MFRRTTTCYAQLMRSRCNKAPAALSWFGMDERSGRTMLQHSTRMNNARTHHMGPFSAAMSSPPSPLSSAHPSLPLRLTSCVDSLAPCRSNGTMPFALRRIDSSATAALMMVTRAQRGGTISYCVGVQIRGIRIKPKPSVGEGVPPVVDATTGAAKKAAAGDHESSSLSAAALLTRRNVMIAAVAVFSSYAIASVTAASSGLVSTVRAVTFEVYSDDNPLEIPVKMFIFTFFGVGVFIFSIAYLIINERRHTRQCELRTVANQRSISVSNDAEFVTKVLGGRGAGGNTAEMPPMSEVSQKDIVATVSGVLALDKGQFDSPEVAKRKSAALLDKSLGVVLDVASPIRAECIVTATTEASSTRSSLAAQVAGLSSKQFVNLVTGGHVSEGSDAANVGGRPTVIALRRVVEVYQTRETRHDKKNQPTYYSYHNCWSSVPEVFQNPILTKVPLIPSTVTGTDEHGKPVERQTFSSLAFAPNSTAETRVFNRTMVNIDTSKTSKGLAPLTIGVTEIVPAKGTLKLWLRPDATSLSSALSSSLKSSSSSSSSSSQQPSSLILRTVEVLPSVIWPLLTWATFNFNHSLTQEGRAAIDRQLSDGSGVRFFTEVVSPADEAAVEEMSRIRRERKSPAWLAGVDATENLLVEEQQKHAAGGENDLDAGGVSRGLFGGLIDHGARREAAYRKAVAELNKKLDANENKAKGDSGKASAEHSSNHRPISNSFECNWTIDDSDDVAVHNGHRPRFSGDSSSAVGSAVLIPSTHLRVSTDGEYLTTVQIDPETGAERHPRVGDVRVRYEYALAGPATVLGAVKDMSNSAKKALFSAFSKAFSPTAVPTTPTTPLISTRHMPYCVVPWTFEDYLDEMERCGTMPKSRKEFALSFASASLPSSAGYVLNKMLPQQDDGTTEAASKDPSKVSTVGGLYSILLSPETFQAFLNSAEGYMAKATPIEVCHVVGRENVSATELFTKRRMRDYADTWGHRMASYGLMQAGLCMAGAVVVPAPAPLVAIGCSLVCAVTWCQTFITAKFESLRS